MDLLDSSPSSAFNLWGWALSFPSQDPWRVLFSLSVLRQNYSLKSQIVNISILMAYLVSIAATQFSPHSLKVATDNTYMNGYDWASRNSLFTEIVFVSDGPEGHSLSSPSSGHHSPLIWQGPGQLAAGVEVKGDFLLKWTRVSLLPFVPLDHIL